LQNKNISLYLEKLFLSPNIIRNLKNQNPESIKKLNTKQLLDYHRKCHMLYELHENNLQFRREIIRIHDMIVKEMERRNLKHKTPLK